MHTRQEKEYNWFTSPFGHVVAGVVVEAGAGTGAGVGAGAGEELLKIKKMLERF
jgi:hypothetical protein